MTSATRTKLMLLVACISLTFLASNRVSSKQTRAPGTLPNPVLFFMGQEPFESGGKSFTRYNYAVENFQAYPSELFTAAPTLPPCGTNTNSSRTWVDIYDQRGKRLQGFCAFQSAADLNKIWFALVTDAEVPSWIYIELKDRQTNTKYKSNLAETVE